MENLKSLEIKTNPYEIKINGEIIDNNHTQSINIELSPGLARVEITKVDFYKAGKSNFTFENRNPLGKSE